MNLLLTSLVVILSAEQLLAAWTKPWYCKSYDCPEFTSESRQSYEIRRYKESFWLATSVTSKTTEASRTQKIGMFWKMFPYFNGRNSEESKVKMAVPALSKVEKLSKDNYRITMMFYIPESNPPVPTTESVKLVPVPARDIYVKEFPSRSMPSAEEIDSNERDLRKVLEDDNEPFTKDVFYSSSYNYPFTPFKKQYEVWIEP